MADMPKIWQEQQARLDVLAQATETAAEPPTIAPGSGGPHDPGMEARVAVLEEITKSIRTSVGRIEGECAKLRTDIEGVRTSLMGELDKTRTSLTGDLDKARDRHDRDFRLTFGALIFVALGLAGLLAKGFHWL